MVGTWYVVSQQTVDILVEDCRKKEMAKKICEAGDTSSSWWYHTRATRKMDWKDETLHEEKETKKEKEKQE